MKKSSALIICCVSLLISCNNGGNTIAAEKNKKDSIENKNINMENKNFTTSILVDQTATIAFDAVKNFRAWWSEEIEGKTDQLNETFFYHYKDVHLSRIKLIELVPAKKLVYQVTDNQFNFTKDKTEWINTKLVFELIPEDNRTRIIFTHEGLVPEYECYSVCHDAWTGYIQGSLKSLIETGKGKPNGKEGGLNAELVKKWGLPNK
jgi:Activator of Hsp90 ATPase homolog 1-like protein